MWNTFTVSIYIVAFGLAVNQLILMISYILFPSDFEFPRKNENKNGIIYYLLQYFQSLMFGVMFFFGVIILDGSLFWILGQWSYVDWRYQLPTVLLGLFLGVQYILGTFFQKPKKLDIVYGITIIIVMEWYLRSLSKHLYYIKNETIFTFAIGAILSIGFATLKFINEIALVKSKNTLKDDKGIDDTMKKNTNSDRENKSNKYIWDIRVNFKKIYSRKLNIVFYCIVIAEFLCKFNGTSIFIF